MEPFPAVVPLQLLHFLEKNAVLYFCFAAEVFHGLRNFILLTELEVLGELFL